MTTSMLAEKTVYRKVTLRIMPFLFVCYLINYLDRINVGYAKLQMLSDLKFNETIYGFGAGIFFIGYIIFQVPSNLALHFQKARLWISCGMIAWGIVSTSTMFVSTPLSFYIMRFLLGVFEAGFFPGVMLYLTYWYPDARRARIISILYAALAFSGIVGGPLSGWILESVHQISGLRGWQWLFLIEGLPAIVLGCLAPLILSNDIRSAMWLTDSEKVILEKGLTKSTHEYQEPLLIGILKNFQIWMATFIYFILSLAGYVIVFYMPTLIKEAGVVGYLNIGLFSAIPYGTAILFMMPLAASSDRRNERRWHLIVPLMATACSLFGMIFSQYDIQSTIVLLSIATASTLSAVSVYWTIPTTLLKGIAAAGGIAFINSLGNIAGFLAPYLFGYFMDLNHSTRMPLLILTFLLVLASVMTYFLPVPKKTTALA